MATSPPWPLSSIRIHNGHFLLSARWSLWTGSTVKSIVNETKLHVWSPCSLTVTSVQGLFTFLPWNNTKKKTIIKRNVTCDETCSSTLQQSPVIRALKRFLALVEVWVSWTLMNCFHCFLHTLLEKLFYLISEKLQEHFRTTKGFPILLRGRITKLKQSGQLLNEIAVTISVIYRFSQG